jgi:S1-C subfamily serine protease
MFVAASCSTTGVATPSTPGPTSTAAIAQPSLESRFIEVIRKVSPSVVAIRTDAGLGSGVVFDTKGDIVTNAHVAAGSTSFRVFLSNGASYKATSVGSFPVDDIAVLRISAPGLQPAQFGDSDHVVAGAIVLAIGSPLGLQGSVTDGIVSAVGRQVVEPNGVALPPVIQTSASINPGNSGGALVDLDGQVIGIPTLAAQDPQAGGAAPGIGFAIPSNIAKDIASQLIQSGRVTNSHRAYLGVQVASATGGQGAAVYAVTSGAPADRAGIRADDVIFAVGDHAVVDQPSLAAALAGLAPGTQVTVMVRRNGSSLAVTVTLGELPG